jgi:hypothetical protein
MSEATRYTSENDAVDWRGLADQIFPADELRTVPAVNFFAVARSNI